MAFSGDGSTALIGEPGANNNAGMAWAYVNASASGGGQGSNGGGAGNGSSGGGGGGAGNAVKPSNLRVKLNSTINRKLRRAKFTFKSTGSTKATGFQCALVKQPKKKRSTARKAPKPHFTRCRSAKSYKHLTKGKYTFEVRPLAGSRIGTVVKRTFSI